MRIHKDILERYRMQIALVTGNLVFASLFMTLALSAFHQPAPHDLKVGVVAPAPVTRALGKRWVAPTRAASSSAPTRARLERSPVSTTGGSTVRSSSPRTTRACWSRTPEAPVPPTLSRAR